MRFFSYLPAFKYFVKKVGKSGGIWGFLCNFEAELHYNVYSMRFLGNIEARTDAKGRAFLPSVFRKALQMSGEETLVLRKDVFQECLVLYPESVWNGQLDFLRSRLNRWNAEHQQIYRTFIADAVSITLDGNGRFLIPKRQMKLACIEQAIRFIGMGDTIEIWASEAESKALLPSDEFGKALQDVLGREKED